MTVAVDTIRRQELEQAESKAQVEALGKIDQQNERLLEAYGGRTSLHDVEHAVDIYEVQ